MLAAQPERSEHVGDSLLLNVRSQTTEVHSLQWRISESLIHVLSTVESRWDPYKPQESVDIGIIKNYLDMWFHLVSVGGRDGR
mgnify:FL=1